MKTRRAFWVAHVHPLTDDPDSGRVISCRAKGFSEPEFSRIRQMLEARFRYVVSPLEPRYAIGPEWQLVAVYCSDNREGKGRVGSGLHMWAVAGPKGGK